MNIVAVPGRLNTRCGTINRNFYFSSNGKEGYGVNQENCSLAVGQQQARLLQPAQVYTTEYCCLELKSKAAATHHV